MTNPDDIVRVRARLEGRASVYEANGWAQAYDMGLLSGNGVLPNTVPDMNVLVGGSQDNPDVVIAQNADGYKIALDIVGQQAVAITAPASQNRISAIVAYTDDLSLASTDSATTGSPSSCGLIVVNGNTAAIPNPPNESTIRTAITADGATGSQACYAVIAWILVGSSSTTISSSSITINSAQLAGSNMVSASNIDLATSTQTITWKNSSNTTVGTTTMTMIPLDNNGLTLCTMAGTAWANNTASGVVNVKGSWETAPTSVQGYLLDGIFSGNVNAYKTFGTVDKTSGIDLWVSKDTSSSQGLVVSLMMVAHFS